MPVDERVVEYIRQNMEQFSMESLKGRLLQSGYTEEDIDKALVMAKQQGSSLPPRKRKKFIIVTTIISVLVVVSLLLFIPPPAKPPINPFENTTRIPEFKVDCPQFIDSLREFDWITNDKDYLSLEKYADLYVAECEGVWKGFTPQSTAAKGCSIDHSSLKNSAQFCSTYIMQLLQGGDFNDITLPALEGGFAYGISSNESCQRLVENNDATVRKRMREYCYLARIAQSGDEQLCDFLTKFSPIDKSGCVIYAKSRQDTCQSLGEPGQYNSCQQLRALQARNESMCDELESVYDASTKALTTKADAITACKTQVSSDRAAFDSLVLENAPSCALGPGFSCKDASIHDGKLVLRFSQGLARDVIPLNVHVYGDTVDACQLTLGKDTLWKREQEINLDFDCALKQDIPYYAFKISTTYYYSDSSPLFTHESEWNIVTLPETSP